MSLSPNPYPGPRPLRYGEQIYGRDREKWDLFHLFNANRIVLLVSPSGAGKSSLIQAGLIPMLEESDFDVWPTIRVAAPPPAGLSANRFTLSVMESLDADPRLPESMRANPTSMASMTLRQYVSSRHSAPDAAPNKVLIFDQFEEVLTHAPHELELKKQFFADLSEMLLHCNCWALFAMREEHLAALDPYRKVLPTQLTHRFRLDLLSTPEAVKAITGPAAERNVKYGAGVAAGLARNLANGSPFVEPVQLQAVCHKLWKKREGNGDIKVSEETQVEFVESSLRDYYDDALKGVCGSDLRVERSVREWFGEKLIIKNRIRDLVMADGESLGIDDKHVGPLLKTYLIREERRARGAWYELAHDRLITPVQASNKAWFELKLSPQAKQARLWKKKERAESALKLTHAFWLKAVEANERAYVSACRRGVMRRFGAAALVVLLAAGVAGYRQTKISQSRGLAAAAEREMTPNAPELSIWLALRALETAYTTEGEEALHHAIQNAGSAEFNGHTKPLWSLAFSADKKWAATGFDDKKVFLWPRSGDSYGEGLELSHVDSVIAVAFSADGNQLAAAGGNFVRIWNTAGKPVELVPDLEHESVVTSVAFSPDAKWLATATREGHVHRYLWSRPGYTSWPKFAGTGKAVREVAFSPDSSSLAAAYADDSGTAKVWRVETGEQLCCTGGAPGGPLVGLAFQPSGQDLAIARDGSSVEIWDWKANRRRLDFPVPGRLTSIAYSSDGEYLLTGGLGTPGRVWRNGSLHLTFALIAGEDLSAVAGEPGGSRAAFAVPGSFVPDGGSDQAIIRSGVRFYDLNLERTKALGRKRLKASGWAGPDEATCLQYLGEKCPAK